MTSGACMMGGGHARQRGVCGKEGVHGKGSMHGRGCAWQGGMHGTHDPQQILGDTVNGRALRILLERILVMKGILMLIKVLTEFISIFTVM